MVGFKLRQDWLAFGFSTQRFGQLQTIFFNNTNFARDIIDLAKQSSTADDTTEQQLKIYNNTCYKFRTECEEVLSGASSFFDCDSRDVEATIAVPATYLAGLDRILASIIAKRNKRLGAGAATVARATEPPPHYKHFRDLFTSGNHTGLINMWARRASGRGFQLNNKGEDFELVPDTAEGKKGCLLATTAAMYHRTVLNNPE